MNFQAVGMFPFFLMEGPPLCPQTNQESSRERNAHGDGVTTDSQGGHRCAPPLKGLSCGSIQGCPVPQSKDQQATSWGSLKCVAWDAREHRSSSPTLGICTVGAWRKRPTMAEQRKRAADETSTFSPGQADAVRLLGTRHKKTQRGAPAPGAGGQHQEVWSPVSGNCAVQKSLWDWRTSNQHQTSAEDRTREYCAGHMQQRDPGKALRPPSDERNQKHRPRAQNKGPRTSSPTTKETNALEGRDRNARPLLFLF